jgi:eukaryotic-like serine/threonine-protein kinase
MAFVLLATDVRHNRAVAIKVMRSELATTVNADRFVREIEIAAGLTHPHILPVHDSGVADGILFYVMPFVEGETLAARIAREGALSVQDTVRFTREIAGALDFAHQRGIVHRDIKPENVLLPGGVAVVADFGLARALETDRSRLRITEVGAGIGSPTYLSPEQALGSSDLDGRSDQYSLACVVFEMLTGRPPFDATSMQAMLAQHISKPPPKASELVPGLPSQLDVVLGRALSKSPSDRYGSMGEFAEELAAATSGAPARRRRLALRWRWAAATAAAVIALGVFASRLPHRLADIAPLDDNVIVVAPFDVLGASLGFWREGLMDVLARSLDGAGPLRAVPTSVVLRSWSGHADRASTVALGRRERAGLAVFGQVIGTGGDSLRVTISLYDVRGDSALTGDFQVLDLASRIDRVGDSATVRLLRALSRSRHISAATTASIGAHNLPALKAFLRGEQLYRRNDFVNARSAYDEAIASDSSFALAYYRVGSTLRWLAGAGQGDHMVFAHRAGELNHGLSARDSLMILADSLLPDPQRGEFVDPAALARSRRRFATLERATVQYPGDPEVWTELAEARLRTGAGPEPRKVMAAIDSAMRVDSMFAPAYRTGIGLTLPFGGRDSALVLARRYLRIIPGDSMIAALTDVLAGRQTDAELRRATDKWPADATRNAAFIMARWPDASAAAVRWFRIMTEKPGAPYAFLGAALRFRGRVGEALQVRDSAFRYNSNGASEFLFASRFAPSEGTRLDSLVTLWLTDGRTEIAPIAVVRAHDRGDTAALVRFTQWPDRMPAAGGSPPAPQREYISSAARAYLALLRRDTVTAEREFGGLADTLAWEQNTSAIVLDAANVLIARNRGAQALELLDRHSPVKTGVSGWQPLWYLTVARASSLVGDRERAESAARYGIAAWSRADPRPRAVLDSTISDLRRRGVRAESVVAP